MFFLLSKLVYALIAPLSWVVYAFLWAWLSRRHRRRAVLLGLVLLYVISNPLLVSGLLRSWEGSPVSIDAQPPFDMAIVLTGGIVGEGAPNQRTASFGPAADRLLQPILLWKQGRVRQLLISGGSGRVQAITFYPDEGRFAAEVARSFGVDSGKVWLEPNSRNTYENAQFSAKLLRRRSATQRLLLVTSAMHLPRATACFEKAGLHVTPYPVDFRAGPSVVTLSSFWPSGESLVQFSYLFKEWVGFLTYRVMGYA